MENESSALEALVLGGGSRIDHAFWRGKKVFMTGNTGFKGSWLSLWLKALGAEVYGYSLPPPTNLSLYALCALQKWTNTRMGDVRDFHRLCAALREASPNIVIHMAAQPLVRRSYQEPADTFEVNVMGTVNVLEAVRMTAHTRPGIRAVLVVSSDKCYENKEQERGYREEDPLGGRDPYSSSKACTELVTASYRSSYFAPESFGQTHRVAVASARAGNVIGGGDWSQDRLVPDCIRSLSNGERIQVRQPAAVRPWQHVLEPLHGYLLLLERLCMDGAEYAEGWNFGPPAGAQTVEWIVQTMCSKWGAGASYEHVQMNHVHEARLLQLDSAKAMARLGWKPVWSLDTALDKVIEWAKAYQACRDMRALCLQQIAAFQADAARCAE